MYPTIPGSYGRSSRANFSARLTLSFMDQVLPDAERERAAQDWSAMDGRPPPKSSAPLEKLWRLIRRWCWSAVGGTLRPPGAWGPRSNRSPGGGDDDQHPSLYARWRGSTLASRRAHAP